MSQTTDPKPSRSHCHTHTQSSNQPVLQNLFQHLRRHFKTRTANYVRISSRILNRFWLWWQALPRARGLALDRSRVILLRLRWQASFPLFLYSLVSALVEYFFPIVAHSYCLHSLPTNIQNEVPKRRNLFLPICDNPSLCKGLERWFHSC